MPEQNLSNSLDYTDIGANNGQIHNLMKHYELILDQNPDDPDAIHFLGKIYAQQGKFDKAIPLLRRILMHTPENAEVFNILGTAFQKTGRMGEAIAAFRQATVLYPHYRAALVNLGNVLAKCGDQAGAIAQYRTILEIDGLENRVSQYREMLADNEYDIVTLNDLGKTLLALDRHEEAANQFRTGLTYAPDHLETAINLGNVLTELGRDDEAIDCYRAILKHHPDSYMVNMKLGKIFHKNRRHPEALDRFRRACALQPGEASASAGLALILQEMGEIDEAVKCFRRAIALAPDRTRYYQCLTRLTKLDADDPILGTLRELVQNKTISLSDHEMADIHFSLGKALSDISEHHLSFEHILKGNAIRRRHIVYDENRVFSGMRKTRELFSAEEISRLAPGGNPSSRPIFIVGMPRSGSTLVEQILSSHPEVYAAGEVSTLLDTFKDAAARFPAWKTVAPLAHLTEAQRHSVAEDYLDRLDRLVVGWDGAGAPQRITNKTLGNYLYIGLIRQLWPNARIIHTFRDPIDTCLSCFSISFNDLDFTFDLGELGRRYRHYQELMAHWRHVLPEGAMLEVRYEDTVDNLEASARRIISYCGLQWDDACLNFHKSRRPVRTSSLAQVRSPIYRSSVGRWRPDGETLRPLLEGLGHEAF